MHSFDLEARAILLMTFGSTTLSPCELVPHPALKAPERLLKAEGPQQEREPLEPLDRA